MKSDKNQEFYRELDQYRHKSGCAGVAMMVIALVVLAGSAYFLLRYFKIL